MPALVAPAAAGHEPTPERTAFVRFGRELARQGLDRVLLDTTTRRLDAEGVAVRTGTLVDATLSRRPASTTTARPGLAGHRTGVA